MDVGPAANLAPHWLFQVEAEPHFPRLEQFPTVQRQGDRFVRADGSQSTLALALLIGSV